MGKYLLLEPENTELHRDNRSRSPSNPRFWGLLFISIGLTISGIVWSSKYVPSTSQEEKIVISGRIESDETDIGTKIAGTIISVAVEEGDKITKHQRIIQLSDEEIRAQLKGANASLISAQQRELQARLQINLVESQILEMQLNYQQAKENTKGQVFQAEASVAANLAQLNEAKAKLEEAQSELSLAKSNRDRFAQLVEQGAVTKQQFDQSQTNFEKAQATVKASVASVNSISKLVKVSEGQLVQAKTSTLNPDIINAQLSRLKTELAQAHLQLAIVQAEVENSKAFKQEIQSKIDYLEISSPIDGIVINRLVEPGEIVSSSQTLLTVINPNDIYLRAYIPQGDVSKIQVGQKAQIFLDLGTEETLSATVTAIDTQASFTPENIYFKEDRVKQVFGIKITIDNPKGFAKPGMPADAEIIPLLSL